jgi:TolB-like protein/Tfp pilus assembly protein PilF
MTASSLAVFLSYASEDAAAAQRLCGGLRASGIEVWLDQSELRGGDAWDAAIQDQIRRCALFIPLISTSSNARGEGYFRLEWRLAVERSYRVADDEAFLLPVVIDNTHKAAARVPERFRERQWTYLPGGTASTEFVAQVQRLLSVSPAPEALTVLPAAGSSEAPRKRRPVRASVALLALIATVVVAVVAWKAQIAWHHSMPRVALTAPAGAPAPLRTSIAVLPFENLSGREADNYLADGLQEEILNALARVRALNVISRTSVMQFRDTAHAVPEIAQRLNVGSILEGSIRRDRNTLRLTVQLIDAHNDRHVLATNYDRDLSRILDLQSTVARQVADALAATLTQYEHGELDRVATNSGDAYDQYLRALARLQHEVPNDASGFAEPRRLLEAALRIDPDFTDALTLLSQTDTWAYFVGGHREDAVKAEQSLRRALALDPHFPDTLLARGLYALYVSHDLEQATNDLSAAVLLRPNSSRAHAALGFALRRRARWSEGLEHLSRAWDLDPLNVDYATAPFNTLVGLRRYPEAIEQANLFTKRDPTDARGYLGRATIEGYLQRSAAPLRAVLREHGRLLDPPDYAGVEAQIAAMEGRYPDAIAAAKKIPVNQPLWRNAIIGFWYLAAGDVQGAQQRFRDAARFGREKLKSEPDDAEALARFAVVESMLGEHAAALATIDRARSLLSEAGDAVNGPPLSFTRSIILVRAGRSAEGYAEAARLLHVPYGSPAGYPDDKFPEVFVVKDDPHYDALIHHPPRL